SDLVTALVTEPFSTVSTGSVISPVGCNASGGSRSAPLSARATSAAAITAQMTIRAVGKTYWRTTPMGFLAAGKWRLHGGSLATLVQADGAAGRKQGVKRRGPRTGRCGALGRAGSGRWCRRRREQERRCGQPGVGEGAGDGRDDGVDVGAADQGDRAAAEPAAGHAGAERAGGHGGV